MKCWLWLLASASSSLVAGSVLATDQERWEDPTREPPAQRRSGFTMGISGGLTVGRASGYPNEAEKIGRREYKADTKLGLAPGSALWLGGAITDWFAVGLGMVGAGLSGNGYTAAGGGWVFHIEAFPLFYVGKAWQNLGVLANFGPGNVQIQRDHASQADGGSMSCVGMGLFYEPLRFWHFSAGPVLQQNYLFSRSLHDYGITAGMRLVFYGGP